MNKYYRLLIIFPLLILTGNPIIAQTKDLSLEKALQYAAKGNRLLQMKILETKKAEEAVKEVKTYLLPTVGLNTSYAIYSELPVIYLRNETTAPQVSDVNYGGRFAFDGTVTASYSLLNLSNYSNIKLAGIHADITKVELNNTEEQLALIISQLYLAIIYHKKERNLLVQSMMRNQQALSDSRSLYLQGKNLKTDTLSHYISVQNLQSAVSVLDNNIQVYSLQLKQLMGMEETVQFIFTDSITTESLESSYPLISSSLPLALENSKGLKIQSLRLEETKEHLKGIKANYKPLISLIGQYQRQSQADNIQMNNYGLPATSFAGIRLSVPLYSGGRLKHQKAQKELGIKQAELSLTDYTSNLETELISLTSNLQEAISQRNIQQQNVEAARISYDMMNERYRYGMCTRLELNDTELALTKAKLNHLKSVYSIKILELQLKKATGILTLN